MDKLHRRKKRSKGSQTVKVLYKFERLKAVKGRLVLLAAAGLVVSAIWLGENTLSNNKSSSLPVTGVPETCPGCILVDPVEFSSLEEIAAAASFTPILPSAIPGDYERVSLLYWRYPSRSTSAPDPKLVHNDWVIAIFRDPIGNELFFSQGFPATPGMAEYTAIEAHGSLKPGGPPADVGSTHVLEGSAFWVKGELRIRPDGPEKAIAMITWFAESTETNLGMPLSYAVGATSASLETLQAIAESIPLY